MHSQKRSVLLLCGLLLLAGCMSSPPTHRSAATATPTPTREQRLALRVQEIMKGMTLDQKVGQMILVSYKGNDYQTSNLKSMIMQQSVGGLIYMPMNGNFDPPENTVAALAHFSHMASSDAKIPLMIATDQEGGEVDRIQPFYGSSPSASQLGASGDPNVAYRQGVQDAQRLTSLGINTDLAPVVDVDNANPSPSYIGSEGRSFGADPQKVTAFAQSFLQGLQHNSIAGCLKHFPGLGALPSAEDPHQGLFTIGTQARTAERLKNNDFVPYYSLIAHEHPAMVMVTDVVMQAIDSQLPAELSTKTITGVLRGQVGYQGVVVTDDIVHMQGVVNPQTGQKYPLGTAAAMAVTAGGDLIEEPEDPQQVAEVVTALKQFSVERIDQSVTRILALKLHYGIML